MMVHVHQINPHIILLLTSLLLDVTCHVHRRPNHVHHVHHMHHNRHGGLVIVPLVHPMGYHHHLHHHQQYHFKHKTVKQYKARFMANYCGKTIKLGYRAELLSLTKKKTFNANWNCTVTVKAPPGYVVRVQVLVISLTISPSNCIHKLDIFSGPSTKKPKSTLLTKKPLCGIAVPKVYYTSKNQDIALRFVGGKGDRKGRDFTLTMTPLRKKIKCGSKKHYFHCKNGYCLDKYHRCDGYNNCGDSTDELHCYELGKPKGLTSHQILIIVFSTLGGSIVIAVFVWYFVGRSSRPADYHYVR